MSSQTPSPVTCDWCLTCKEEAAANHRQDHDLVCRPATGWGGCDCRYCRRVPAQMAQSASRCICGHLREAHDQGGCMVPNEVLDLCAGPCDSAQSEASS